MSDAHAAAIGGLRVRASEVKRMRIAKWMVAGLAFAALALVSRTSLKAEDTAPAADKGIISVTVVDDKGAAVAGADVKVMVAPPMAHKDHKPATKAEKPAKGEKKAEVKPVAEGTTDAEGKLTLKDIPVGEYLVMAKSATGMGREHAKVEAGKTAEVKVIIKAKAAKK